MFLAERAWRNSCQAGSGSILDVFGGKDDLVDEDLNLRSNAASAAVRVSAMGVGLKNYWGCNWRYFWNWLGVLIMWWRNFLRRWFFGIHCFNRNYCKKMMVNEMARKGKIQSAKPKHHVASLKVKSTYNNVGEVKVWKGHETEGRTGACRTKRKQHGWLWQKLKLEPNAFYI